MLLVLLFFLLLLLLLLLLFFLLLLLLRLLSRLFLTLFDIGLMLHRVFLLLLVALGLVGAFLSLLLALAPRFVKLVLVVRLLLVVRRLVRVALRLLSLALCLGQRMLALLFLIRLLVRRTLRRLGLTLRLIERMLLLLLFVRLRACRFVGSALRRIGFVLRALQCGLLVALLRMRGTFFVVERQLLAADIGLHDAHLVARLADAMIHKERAIAVVLRDCILIVVLRATTVQHLLPRVEVALLRLWRAGGPSHLRRCERRVAQSRRLDRRSCRTLLLQRPCHPDRLREGRNAHTEAQRDGTNCPKSGEPPRSANRRAKPGKGQIRGEAEGRQRLLWAAEHGGNSNTPRVERPAIYGKMPRSTGRRAHPATRLFAHWAPRALEPSPAAGPQTRTAIRSSQEYPDPMTETVALKIVQRIATELSVQPRQVAAAVQLLDEGSTVPFIARYRKEVTGNLDDTQLRTLEERLLYLRELEDRRAAILTSIEEQGKLTDELRSAIEAADSKQVLEDLYLPYKPKRRTRAQIAREAGLQPLADALLANPLLDPQTEAAQYVDAEKGVADIKAALDGARDILSEQFGETAELLGKLRDWLHNQGVVKSSVVEGKENEEGEKFRDYYDYSETIKTVPSHRALALFRGRNAGVLMVKLGLGGELDTQVPHPGEAMIARHFGIANQNRPADKWLSDVCRWCWRVKVQPHIENELLTNLREQAENEAIRVFARNLKDLLLAAPAGPKAVIGLDPGLRTGVKVAVVDRTGKLLATDTIYPHEPRRDWDGSLAKLARIAAHTQAELISIGNGTASRETDKLASELISKHPELKLQKIVVSEAGASVYSASELAAKEFPELDVSLRGAVSIARRLQDPLAELVKIEPKAIGVGQYQHDVNQRELARSLDAVVEDCVNAVGVDANTASVALLARVSGLNSTLARNIVDYRDANGPFPSREQLKKVPRLGDKTFEQAAGFLRINGGDNPLDRSSVHPEAYPVVERMLAKIKRTIGDVLGSREALSGLAPIEFVDERFGLPTVRDILSELEKPGRDPRPEFKTATFRDGVEKVSDLVPGMLLEGVVTNVAAFGAFIDVGVHQDGLVHVSALSTKFIKDPHEVVKAGQVVKVKVLDVDVKRQRIALTMRLDDDPASAGTSRSGGSAGQSGNRDNRGGGNRDNRNGQRSRDAEPAGAMAAAFAKLKPR